MYNNRQSQVLDREETQYMDYEQERMRANENMRGNLDKILNYENYRKTSSEGSTITADRVTTKKVYAAPAVNFIPLDDYDVSMSAAVREELATDDVVREAVYADETADTMPSSTTMQFSKDEDAELYEEIKSKSKAREEKDYRINTRGKVLIAVYALVVVTIFSLILLNARMLKNLDSSIENYSAKVNALSGEYTRLSEELDVARANETIISKAEEMGMVRGK